MQHTLTLLIAATLANSAQAPRPPDASEVFGKLVDQAKRGFVCGAVRMPAGIFDGMAKDLSLTKRPNWPFKDSVGGDWSLTNATGTVSMRATCPSLSDRNLDHVEMAFAPRTETPMPQAMLAHLLGKATKTTMSSGDTLAIRWDDEDQQGLRNLRCSSWTTLTIRVGTGAMVMHELQTLCEAIKK